MKPLHKVALVAAGYAASLLIATVVVAVRVAAARMLDAQSSGGMYAFGDSLAFVGVFGVCALVPTGAGLFFLRQNSSFWKGLSAVGVAVAVTGVAAAIVFTLGRGETRTPLATWSEFSVLRILVSPVLALTLFVCSAFSPQRPSRLMLLSAAVTEAAVSVCAGVFIFLHIP